MPWDIPGRCAFRWDRADAARPALLPVAEEEEDRIPAPNERAGIAIETRGRSVQSSTHSSDAKLVTITRRSFQGVVVSSFIVVVVVVIVVVVGVAAYPEVERPRRDGNGGNTPERGGNADGGAVDGRPVRLLLLLIVLGLTEVDIIAEWGRRLPLTTSSSSIFELAPNEEYSRILLDDGLSSS
jgi:hypothetical protein